MPLLEAQSLFFSLVTNLLIACSTFIIHDSAFRPIPHLEVSQMPGGPPRRINHWSPKSRNWAACAGSDCNSDTLPCRSYQDILTLLSSPKLYLLNYSLRPLWFVFHQVFTLRYKVPTTVTGEPPRALDTDRALNDCHACLHSQETSRYCHILTCYYRRTKILFRNSKIYRTLHLFWQQVTAW